MYVFKHNDNVLNYAIAIQDIMSRFNALGGLSSHINGI